METKINEKRHGKLIPNLVRCQMLNIDLAYPFIGFFAFFWSLLLIVKVLTMSTFISWTFVIMSPLIFMGGMFLIFSFFIFGLYLVHLLFGGNEGECCGHKTHGT